MKINLNDPKNFTINDIKRLIMSGDDSNHSQFRVDKNGYLYLSKIISDENLEGVKFRLEINCATTGHVGLEAANDKRYVLRIYNAIKNNWPNPSSDYIDNF